MSLIELDEYDTSLKAIVIFGAFDTNKLNKSERTALETLQVAASQLQALHDYPVLRVGVTFDSAFQLPFTVGSGKDFADLTEEEKAANTLAEGPYSRLTIPRLTCSRLFENSEYGQLPYGGHICYETSFIARDIWELVDLFKKGLETHTQDLEHWAEELGSGLSAVAYRVIDNVKATLKTIEPPAALIKQDAA